MDIKHLYPGYIRPVARRTLVSLFPAPHFAKQRLVVSGLPRSGTSWIARAVSLAPRVSYYFEPDHILDSRYWYKYLAGDERDAALETHINAALSGRIQHEYVIAEQSLQDIVTHIYSNTILVKWVKLVLAIDWVAALYPDLRVIQTVRHPVPLVLSWRTRSWDPGYSLKRLLSQENLMRGPLLPFVGILEDAESFWEKAGAFWASIVYLQWQFHRPGWILKEHEWYCVSAEERIRWLLGEMGLSVSNKMLAFINSRSAGTSGPGYGAARDPKTEIHKWEKHITAQELDELENVVRRFSLPFYPGMDPESFWNGNNIEL